MMPWHPGFQKRDVGRRQWLFSFSLDQKYKKMATVFFYIIKKT
jgi:hypothetical protein